MIGTRSTTAFHDIEDLAKILITNTVMVPEIEDKLKIYRERAERIDKEVSHLFVNIINVAVSEMQYWFT